MEQIKQIYYNDFGVAFYWKKEGELLLEKVQLVFKEIGFYFSYEELKMFFRFISISHQKIKCEGCALKSSESKYLLKTPCKNVDLAVSEEELSEIEDLIQGTLFQISLDHYLNELCRN